jgi:hypothetical protein
MASSKLFTNGSKYHYEWKLEVPPMIFHPQSKLDLRFESSEFQWPSFEGKSGSGRGFHIVVYFRGKKSRNE